MVTVDVGLVRGFVDRWYLDTPFKVITKQYLNHFLLVTHQM